MSLLMQALKKAERAKQNALPEEDQDKPSEAFDEALALTPDAAPAKPASAAELSLEPMDGLSLEPLAPPVAAATTEPRPSPSPLPAASDHKAPGLTMDLALDPVVAPPEPAPAPAPAPSAGPAAAAGAGAGIAAGAAIGAAASANTTAKAAPTTPRSASAAQGGASVGAGAGAGAGARSGTPAAGTGTGAGAGAGAGPAARARSRTAATPEPTGLDPERLRLIGLIALLVLVVGGFGIYYWRALTAPGAGAGLPPVPMPPPGATGATPGPGLIIAAGPGAATGAAAAPDETDPMLAPSSAGSSRVQQELERRLSKTEQDLAAAQQTIQAVAAANAPRPEQMPVLAAPDNSEIRVSRAVQASPVAPALDSAYQSFNSGDLGAAQQQYDAALVQDANNRDALLGAAHVAARQNQKDRAAAYYLRLLELSPNDADATAGLIGLRQGDISLSEARLKAILANNPEAGPVLFALGNLYAQQGRWPDAQQAYFRAVGAAPDNPDYAYNLAIGLDRLNQGRLALGYYQRALAQDKTVGFDRNALRQRMHELGGAPKQ